MCRDNTVLRDQRKMKLQLQHDLSSNSYSYSKHVLRECIRHVELPSLKWCPSHLFSLFHASLIHTKHVYELTSPKEARSTVCLGAQWYQIALSVLNISNHQHSTQRLHFRNHFFRIWFLLISLLFVLSPFAHLANPSWELTQVVKLEQPKHVNARSG